MMIDPKLVSYITSKVRASAESARMNAGYNGEWGDRGASAKEEKLNAWLDGIAGRVPECWRGLEAEMMREQDRDYVEYKRLKVKFGDLE